MSDYRNRESFSMHFFLRQRELGHKKKIGSQDRLSTKLLTSILPCSSGSYLNDVGEHDHGGVFNLEFSPDGSLLVAACEKKSILIFDPLCRRLIHRVDNAHRDCVNCVRFLDSRVFATCSDDSTVALWDARNLKSRMRSLYGHSNWVKNIEFSSRQDLLVTSGFDGSIYTWDINSYTERGVLYNRVFHTNGMMRTCLNPDATKMVVSTSGGYLIIIHDLDLHKLALDLHGFKPNLYRYMNFSEETLPMAVCFSHLFPRSRRRNTVEFVTDFPVNDDAEFVSSLQVHPQGWSVLSRNASSDESSEWSCVHDIQEKDPESDEEEIDSAALETGKGKSSAVEEGASRGERPVSSSSLIVSRAASSSRSSSSNHYSQSTNSPPPTSTSPHVPSASAGPSPRSSSQDIAISGHGRTAVNPNQPLYSNQSALEVVSAIRNARMLRENRSNTVYSGPTLSRPNAGAIELGPIHKNKMYKNINRLTHFCEEPSVGRGIIKELCFGAGGRLVCSPFGLGVRLLAFSPDCSELCTVVPPSPPIKLHEVATNICHCGLVVSTKFSPTQCLLVSGCLNGEIVWHQPIL